MQDSFKSSRDGTQRTRWFGVGLMLSLWLVLIGLSSSEGLHQLLHADSHSPNHECVVKSFEQGSLLQPTVAVLLPELPEFVAEISPVVSSLDSHLDLRLAPGRAPPVLS